MYYFCKLISFSVTEIGSGELKYIKKISPNFAVLMLLLIVTIEVKQNTENSSCVWPMKNKEKTIKYKHPYLIYVYIHVYY